MEQGIDLHGASAIIEKDLASELLAEELDADTLLILTSVEKSASTKIQTVKLCWVLFLWTMPTNTSQKTSLLQVPCFQRLKQPYPLRLKAAVTALSSPISPMQETVIVKKQVPSSNKQHWSYIHGTEKPNFI